MFIINIYTGGKTLHGPNGVHYSQGPTINFTANDNLTLDELKGEIYHRLEVTHEQNELNIRVCMNISPSATLYFTEYQILDNDAWNMVVDKMVTTGKWPMIELFVDVVQLGSSNILRPGSSRPQRHNTTRECRSSGIVMSPPVNVEEDGLEEIDEFADIFNDVDRPSDRIVNLVFSDNTPFENTCGNENFFNGVEINVEEEEDDVGSIDLEISNRSTWGLRGRSESHPVPSFNDVGALLRIQGDGDFFGNELHSSTGALEEGTLYKSKAHLKWCVHDYHIKKNKTFRMKKSNQSVYTIICTESEKDCNWRLYATRREE